MSGDPAAHLVTIVFQPPGNAQRNVAVLATSCAAIEPLRAACEARADVATATCLQANRPGQPLDLVVPSPADLRLRFPDTDGLVLGPTDDVTYAGPAAIAVSTANATELPCGLAAPKATCATLAGVGGLLACVDELFSGEVTGCTSVPDRRFERFTALPPPNDYQAVCSDPLSICTGAVNDLRIAIDSRGNVLMPMDWRGILAGESGVPLARLLRGTSSIEAFAGTGVGLAVPGNSFLASFSPEGGKLPPIFDPLADPSDPDLALFGSADAPQTVLRIARRSASFRVCTGPAPDPCNTDEECPTNETCTSSAVCVGGANAGEVCAADGECPDGDCGAGLFDFATRLVADGAGPVVVRKNRCLGGANAFGTCEGGCPGGACASFVLSALDPVPLDGLAQTDVLNAFVLSEAIADRDLNGDGDVLDDVARIGDRLTGVVQAIGPSGAPARAIARVSSPPFAFPALAADGDVVAFLEPETAQGFTDLNGNGRTFDHLLRAYRNVSGSFQDAVGGALLSADAAPAIDGRSLAASAGYLFFRLPEWRRATQAIRHASAGAAPRVASLTDDGRRVLLTDFGNTLRLYDVATSTVVASYSFPTPPLQAPNPKVARDGSAIVFESDRSNIVPGDTNIRSDVFVFDVATSQVSRVSVNSDEQEMTGGPPDSLPYQFLSPSISGDGRFVAFSANHPNLAPGDSPNTYDVFVRDRMAGTTERITNGQTGAGSNVSSGTALSADGRFVAFGSFESDLVAGDTNGVLDIFLHDRSTGETSRVSVSSRGEQANAGSREPSLSSDGAVVAFRSDASNLVPGDTNGASDVFVFDASTRATTRVSVGAGGIQANGFSYEPRVSPDGRFVGFGSFANNLVPVSPPTEQGAYVHDRFTGTTWHIPSRPIAGFPSPPPSLLYDLSRDARRIAFGEAIETFVFPETGMRVFTFAVAMVEPDAATVGADLTGDGDVADVVLARLDSMQPAGSNVAIGCPSSRVATANGAAAFLRPESAGGGAGCPVAAPSLNGDGDQQDDVVHLWLGGTVSNLGVAARDVALSASHVAALVSESAQGGSVLNADGDALDAVVHVQTRAVATAGGWSNLTQAADAMGISGGVVAFLTPEAAQGAGSINGDADSDDRVLQIYDEGAAIFGAEAAQAGSAAEEFVLGGSPGEELVAFRTDEAAEGGDLNDDGDVLDDVLRIFDVATRRLLEVGAAVTPCTFEACDPKFPYKVGRDTVTFLTFECEQGGPTTAGCASGGTDLNGDGDAGDLVLQLYNARLAAAAASGGGAGLLSASRLSGAASHGGSPFALPLAAVSAGVCTTTATACASDATCVGGRCFVPPGGCLRNLGTTCNPTREDVGENRCAADSFCDPILGSPESGVCKKVTGPCAATTDCVSGDVCNLSSQTIQRLSAPFSQPELGGEVFTSGGKCLETVSGSVCTTEADCATGTFCSGGQCTRDHGTCRTTDDCPPSSACRQDLVVATAADSDGDEIPDSFDNCPDAANVLQEDFDEDGEGDACDAPECGNGLLEPGEDCEEGACCAGCRFAPSTTECRPVSGACDVAETCSGASAACPADGFAASGTPCDDGDACTVGDQCSDGVCQPGGGQLGCGACRACSPVSGCVTAPRLGCVVPAKVGGSKLSLTERPIDFFDLAQWTTGATIPSNSDFGDPTTSASYALCVFDQQAPAPSLRFKLEVPPGGTCGTTACWKAKANAKGFQYRDRAGARDGTTEINLLPGALGKGKIKVKAKGLNVPALGLPYGAPVTVQLQRSDGGCWEARFSAPSKNDPATFRAKSD